MWGPDSVLACDASVLLSDPQVDTAACVCLCVRASAFINDVLKINVNDQIDQKWLKLTVLLNKFDNVLTVLLFVLQVLSWSQAVVSIA